MSQPCTGKPAKRQPIPLLGLKFKQRENGSLKTNRQPVGRGRGKNSVLPTGIAALRREMANPLPQ